MYRLLELRIIDVRNKAGYNLSNHLLGCTTVEVWTKGGLVTFYLLFVMELATRRVHLAACTPSLGDDFMKQIARNLTDPFDGFLKDKRYVLIDRDANFSIAFRRILKQADVEPVRLPPRSPNLNSHLERFHLSLKSECLDKMIFFGERSLRNAWTEFFSIITVNEITKGSITRSSSHVRKSARSQARSNVVNGSVVY